MQDWWKTFFDADYLRVWGALFTPEQDEQQAEGIWKLLQLRPGSRLLDAPCGYGRLSVQLAKRGAVVLGVDQSETLLAEAGRNNTYSERLRYLQHDLRKPLPEGGFDAVCNVFSSIGYGTEEDDLAVFTTLHNAVRPGGLVLIETNHRDTTVVFPISRRKACQQTVRRHPCRRRAGVRSRRGTNQHQLVLERPWWIRKESRVPADL